MYEFETRTGRIAIDLEQCRGCKSFACIKACSLYGSGILRLERGRPALAVEPDEAKRRCLECLACELDCRLQALQALSISLPIEGLETYRRAAYGDSAA